jgi:hypothetical protein
VIKNDDGSHGANAQCGEAATLSFDAAIPDVDYSDPEAVAKASRDMQRKTNEMAKKIKDNATLFLVGEKTAAFDGGQVVTVTGEVIEPMDGTNAMGAKMTFPTVRVDYAE